MSGGLPRGLPLWLRCALALFPPGFRKTLADDLGQRVMERRARARARGGMAYPLFLFRTFCELSTGALLEHVAERRRCRPDDDTTWRMMMDTLARDLRFAVRALVVRNPVFTVVAVSTLALGVGANTTVFSIVDNLLLRPLPFEEAHQLVQIWEVDEAGNRMSVASANFLDWSERSRSFEHMVARTNPAFGGPITVLGGNEAVRVKVDRVTGGFFEMMGTEPRVGRALLEEDHTEPVPSVAVVSSTFWEQQMGSEPLDARTLQVGPVSLEVVGVMPPGFDFPDGTQLWVPAALAAGGSRTSHNHLLTARLRDDVTMESAVRELNTITAALKSQYGSEMDAVGVDVIPLHEEMYGEMETPLLLLMGAAGLVLLVACTNLASTLLARGRTRTREFAVRASLGASRSRILSLVVTESLLLAVLGTSSGLVLARPTLEVFLRIGPPALDGAVALDPRVLLSTSVVCIATVLVFGLLPAWSAARASQTHALRAGSPRSGRGRRLGWSVLVGGEVALCLMLITGSTVLLRSLVNVLSVEMGFEPSRVLTAEVALPASAYPDDAAIHGAHTRILEEVRRVPDVTAAGLVNHLPLSGIAFNGGFDLEGLGPAIGSVDYRVASTGYVESMGIPVLEGRAFEERDDAMTGDVAVISRAMAERYWPTGDALGRRIQNLRNDSWIYPDRRVTIVGVVGDIRHRTLSEPPAATVYVHSAQRPARAASSFLAVRTRGDPSAAADAVRQAIRRVDTRIPLSLATMEERIGSSVTDRRFTLLVLGAFAAVALVLAAVGIYGVVSFAVASRTREMGIRLALGARPERLLGLVMTGSLRVVLIGAALGVIGSFASARFLRELVFEVRPIDPLSLVAGALVLVAVGAAATWVPARRATRVNPVATMKAE